MNRENYLPAIQKLSSSLSEEMPPEFACILASRFTQATLQRDTKSIEKAKRSLDDLPRLVPAEKLAEIPGVEPFASVEGWRLARQQGMIVMFRRFLDKLPVSSNPLNKLSELAEQSAAEIKCNPCYGEKRGVDAGYKEGVQAAKNKLHLFLNHLPV